MDIFELAAKIKLDTSEFEAGIGQAKSLVGGLGDVLSGPMGVVADVFSFAKDNIGDAVEVAKGFDSKMSQVAATMGYTNDELANEVVTVGEFTGNLADFAQQMGATTQFSAAQAAEALNYMALAGYKAETSVSMLPTVLDLAAAGGMQLGTASDMVTDAQSALGLSLEETADMVDIMAQTSSKSNTSVAQLGEAFLTVGGNAKNLKGGTAELAQVLGLLADNGIKGAEGGTHLRNIMLSMTPSSEAAAAAFEQLGLDAYDAQGNMRAFADIFGEMQAKMANMSSLERTNILTGMFNKTDLAAVNALLDTSAERWQELGGYIAEAGGAAAQMAATQLDNLAGAETLLDSAKEGLKIAIGSYFTDIKQNLTTELADSIGVVTSAINEGGIAAGFEALMGIVGSKLQELVGKLPEYISAAVPMVTQAFASIGQGVMAAMPVIFEAIKSLLPVVIEAFQNAVPTLLENIKTLIVNAFNALKEAAPQIASTVGDTAKQAFEALKGGVSEYAGKVWEAIKDLADKIYNAMPASMKAVFDDIGTFLRQAGEGVSNMVKSLWEAVKAWWDYMKTLFEAMWPTIEPILTALAKGFIEYFKQLWENIKLVFLTLVDVFTDVFDIIKGVCTAAAGIIKGDFEQAEKGIEVAWDGLISFFKDIWEGVKAVFENAVGFFENIGSMMWEGLKSGITNAISGVKEWGGNVLDAVKGVFGIKSPSREFRKIGNYITQGLEQGMTANIDSVIEDYGSRIVEGVAKSTGSIRFNDSALGRGFSDTISSMFAINAEGAEQETNINLVVDGKTLAGVVYNPLNNLVKQKGVVLGA